MRVMALSCLLLIVSHIVVAAEKPAIITGTVYQLNDGDSMLLTLYGYGISGNQDYEQVLFTTVYNHRFKFTAQLEHASYFRLAPKTLSPLGISRYLLESGDEIDVDFGDKDVVITRYFDRTGYDTRNRIPFQFLGKGAGKYAIIKTLNEWPDVYDPTMSDGQQFAAFRKRYDSVCLEKLRYLSGKRSLLSSEVYDMLEADLLSAIVRPYRITRENYKVIVDGISLYHDQGLVEMALLALSHNTMAPYCRQFGEAVINREKARCLCGAEPDSSLALKVSVQLADRYTGVQRDMLLSSLVFEYRNSGTTDLGPLVDNALKYVKIAAFTQFLEHIRSGRTKGSVAYPFALPDVSGRMRRLSEFRGKVVVLDFFYTGCGACRFLAPKLKAIEEDYEMKDVVFISVSIDRQKAQWIQSVNSKVYTSPDIINLYTDGQMEGHEMIRRYYVSGYPTLILVDKNGKICANPISPNEDGGTDLKRILDGALEIQ
ncbi:TlpA family protein disulfide reductase [Flavitalea flava]